MNRRIPIWRSLQATIPLLVLGIAGCDSATTTTSPDETQSQFVVAPINMKTTSNTPRATTGTRRGIANGADPRIQFFRENIPNLPKRPNQLGTCSTMVAPQEGEKNSHFTRDQVELEFPPEMIEAAEGNAMGYNYWRVADDDPHHLLRLTTCLIPRSTAARNFAWNRFSLAGGAPTTLALNDLPKAGPLDRLFSLVQTFLGPRKLFAAPASSAAVSSQIIVEPCADDDPNTPCCEIDPQNPDCDDVEGGCSVQQSFLNGCTIPDGFGGVCRGSASAMWVCTFPQEDFCEARFGINNGCTSAGIGFISLLLACDPVIRGVDTECEATRSSLSPLWNGGVVFDWFFQPDPIVLFPGEAPTVVASRVPAGGFVSTGNNKWNGKAVLSGMVTVVATDLNGPHLAEPASLTVDPRTTAGWTATPSSMGAELSPGARPTFRPGTAMGVLGENTNPDGSMGLTLQGSVTQAVVPSGPNKGYTYHTSTTHNYDRRVWFNEHLKPYSIRFDYFVGGTSLNFVDATTFLAGPTPAAALFSGVKSHEKDGQSPPSHQAEIEREVLTVCGNINKLLESIAGSAGTSTMFADAVNTVKTVSAKHMFDQATGHSMVHDHRGTLPIAFINSSGVVEIRPLPGDTLTSTRLAIQSQCLP